jgi:hypothetical protein
LRRRNKRENEEEDSKCVRGFLHFCIILQQFEFVSDFDIRIRISSSRARYSDFGFSASSLNFPPRLPVVSFVSGHFAFVSDFDFRISDFLLTFALAEDGAEDACQFVGFVDEPIAFGVQFAVITGIHQTQEVTGFLRISYSST